MTRKATPKQLEAMRKLAQIGDTTFTTQGHDPIHIGPEHAKPEAASQLEQLTDAVAHRISDIVDDALDREEQKGRTQSVQTSHVLYALEKLGQDPLARAITAFKSELGDFGFDVKLRLTVKEDEIRLGITVTPEDVARDDRQPTLIGQR